MLETWSRESEQHKHLRDAVLAALDSWHGFLIALDGVDGAGKSQLGRYLSWQLQMPVIETDLFLVQGAGLSYRIGELENLVQQRLNRDKPVIIEGVCLLRLLTVLEIKPDYLVWVDQVGYAGSHTLKVLMDEYAAAFSPRERADFVFSWVDQAEYDN